MSDKIRFKFAVTLAIIELLYLIIRDLTIIALRETYRYAARKNRTRAQSGKQENRTHG